MTSSNMHILTIRAILFERNYPNCRKLSLKTRDKEPILKTKHLQTLGIYFVLQKVIIYLANNERQMTSLRFP